MKHNLILSILFLTFISCNDKSETTNDHEKKLLEKELEITKRELEIEKKENQKVETSSEESSINKTIPNFNYKNPEQIVEAIIYAAKNKDFDVLANLCDPQEKGDVESLCLCRLSSKYKSEYAESQNCSEITKKEFLTLFQKARNPQTIKNDGMYATVEYEVENLDVKMEMVKRKSRWYIFSLSSSEPGEE
ncbi:MAG: hypothetical protein ABIQ27_00220 [Flavobacterium sp.]|uniref:hypothetical protein n=1 Tax=Flavobacterium sp. TaxID=239 RepID=UPI0032643F3E